MSAEPEKKDIDPVQTADAAAAALAAQQAEADAAAKALAEAEPKPKMINVITTAVGAMPMQGIIPVGTRMEVPVEAFSDKWMKPADIGASQRLKAAAKKA